MMRSLMRKIVNIKPNLVHEIPQCDFTFESYLPTVNTTLNETANRR